jgi:hypothetical protein
MKRFSLQALLCLSFLLLLASTTAQAPAESPEKSNAPGNTTADWLAWRARLAQVWPNESTFYEGLFLLSDAMCLNITHVC